MAGLELKSLMKRENKRKCSAAPSVVATRKMRNFILVLCDLLHEAKYLSTNSRVLLILGTIWKLQRGS